MNAETGLVLRDFDESGVWWVSDGGHEWLRVPKYLMSAVDGVSSYSYQDTQSVYLEGDCDARLFFEAYGIEADSPQNTGFMAREKSYNGEAPCRSYARYQAA